MLHRTASLIARSALLGVALLATPGAAASAQWSTVHEQFYLQAKHNWKFRDNYPGADRLFNAFDYGHAILYERLWTDPDGSASVLEEKEYNFITRELLANPPHVPLEEAAIEIAYAKLAPEAKAMFEWAHILHRQIYDVWADERYSPAEKDQEVARLVSYYKSRRDVAFSSRPKTMELMEGQPYSVAFRREFPKFNGLIWAYHWLQVGLYEPLLVGRNKDERMTGVTAAVARFRQMIENAPSNMPRVMPMTAAVAPEFARRYPEASIIFDNLHSMHDVISDILANDSLPRNQKRSAILEAARRYRDDTSFVTTESGWRDMSAMMGVQNMGGPAVGFLPAFPTPTVARGAVMASMNHGAMPGMDHAATPATRPDSSATRRDTTQPDHSQHAAAAKAASAPAPVDHAAMGHAASPVAAASATELHMRLLMDSVVRRRVVADTAMRRMMLDAASAAPAEHRAHMEALLAPASGNDKTPVRRAAPSKLSKPAAGKTSASTARKPTAKKVTPAVTPPKAPPAIDHSKHVMPPAKKP